MKLTQRLVLELDHLNRTQAEFLKLPWPPVKGWRYALLRQDIPIEVWEKVLDMRGLSPGKRRKLLKLEKEPELKI